MVPQTTQPWTPVETTSDDLAYGAPTARLILPAGDLDAPDYHRRWLEVRRTGIGGSEVAKILGLNKYQVATADVPDGVREDASDLATTVRAEVARDEPDPGTLRRALATLRGYLAPIAISTVAAGATAGGEETAHALIERLSNVL
ncbi:hypothetical protein [Streptomyces sp. Root369]|uniref:hypothetical protein n=1 Tax=Streptomyces sp. Root369 TaxID=1736523 RepID=UPI000708D5C8|nr:hypothetical protein [Streptomyces sp. Root369]KQV93972.1 hypothetical protein ASD08_18475 [Streptomyces sp. Root369]